MTNDEQREAFEALFGKRHKYHTTREWDTALTAWYAATAAERERCAKALEVDASEWEDHADNHADDDEDKQMSLARVDSLRELAAAFREGTQ